jgi:DNA (cytosine-5)-methyltransferase 1
MQLQFPFQRQRPTARRRSPGGELVCDNFAGGGGASTGMEQALRRAVDVAINHSRRALEMHELNHPYTHHICEDIFSVGPREIAGDRPIGLAWFSPDCTHHSRAKGGKPRSNKIRGLAWVVIKWAKAGKARPRVIILENVREFQDYGPLDEDGMPDRARKGLTFRRWLGQLKNAGYQVEWRVLDAADYGAPTHRKRLFLVARCDGRPICWPEPTHGPGRAHPYHTAAECIDWSLPVPSIFERKRPLAEATCRRIAAGIVRYVIQAKEPFIVTCNHSGPEFRGQGLREPMKTITASRDAHGLVIPVLAKYHGSKGGESRCHQPGEPLRTLDTSNRYGLVTAFLAKHYGGMVGHQLTRPIGTITARDHHSIVAAHLTKFYGTSIGARCDGPMPTITDQGQHVGLVAAFLVKYYGSGGQWAKLDEPMHTIVTKARMGLVLVPIGGEEWVLSDIGMRMLEPHELAAAQGFPPEYILIGTKAQQINAIGNSVCPVMAKVLTEANYCRQEMELAVS